MGFRVYLYDKRGLIVGDHALSAASVEEAIGAAAKLFKASDARGYELRDGNLRVLTAYRDNYAPPAAEIIPSMIKRSYGTGLW